ncbi:hypothetical protein DUI87_34556 [Hirundo rustica rustica]|uniref:Uncharacterized protein n=1 Tax=Hirundo rustica rustica TaxID=333673 RepID=A0A3M0IL09_HIRRU|nr:hypothetical protein DUI87_34556 [Hirundo rustica rustica]
MNGTERGRVVDRSSDNREQLLPLGSDVGLHRFPDPLYYYPPQILHIDSVILLLMIPIGILQRPLGVC